MGNKKLKLKVYEFVSSQIPYYLSYYYNYFSIRRNIMQRLVRISVTNTIGSSTRTKPLAVLSRNFFKVVPAYKQGIRLTFGKYDGQLINSGLNMCLPFIHKIYLADMRDQLHQLPKQPLITRDGVTLNVDASVQFKIMNSHKALLQVVDAEDATLEKCKMQLRNILCSTDLFDIMHKRDAISNQVVASLAGLEETWGIRVSAVQIRDIAFDDSIKRAMSAKAEADKQAEAKIINARADIETAKMYAQAAAIYAENPITLRLREFQLWTSVAKNPSTTMFVIPSNICDSIGSLASHISPVSPVSPVSPASSSSLPVEYLGVDPDKFDGSLAAGSCTNHH
jgi:erythrocyte band 7 integral membrane protein